MAIDEKKLIEELEEQYKNLIPEDDWDYCKIRQIKADIKVINRQPTIQPQGIDKDGLIEFLNKESAKWTELLDNGWEDCVGAKSAIRSVLDWVNQLPTSDGWIPCSKELPKEEGWYQCSCYSPERWSKGLVRDLYWYPTSQQFVDNIRYSTNGFDDIKKYYWTEWVIAWWPLPQPYKESE